MIFVYNCFMCCGRVCFVSKIRFFLIYDVDFGKWVCLKFWLFRCFFSCSEYLGIGVGIDDDELVWLGWW